MSKDDADYLLAREAEAEANRKAAQAEADRQAAEVTRLHRMAAEEDAEVIAQPPAPAPADPGTTPPAPPPVKVDPPAPAHPPVPIDPPVVPGTPPGTIDPPAPPPVVVPPPTTGETFAELHERLTGFRHGYASIPADVLATMPWPVKKNVTGGGEHGDLGVVPDVTAIAIISDDPRALKAMNAMADLIDEMPVHFTDKATGKIIRLRDFPDAGDQYGYSGTRKDGTTWALNTQPQGLNGWTLDLQHHPHYAWGPFLDAYRKGDRARMLLLIERQKHVVVANYLKLPYFGRKQADGVFNTAMTACDIRGAGWGNLGLDQLVAMMHLAGLNADNDEHFADFLNSSERNIEYTACQFLPDTPVWRNPDQSYPLPDGALKNSLTVFGNANTYDRGDGIVRLGAFQLWFYIQSRQFAYGLAKSGALPVSSQSLEYLQKISLAGGKFAVRFGGDGKNGSIDFRRGMHQFVIPVGRVGPVQGVPIYFTTDAELAMDMEHLGPLPDEAVPGIRYHDSNDIIGAVTGGYTADYLPCLVSAVRDDVPGAEDTLARLKRTSNWQQSRGFGGVALQFAYSEPGALISDGVDATPAPAAGPAAGPAPAPASGTTTPAPVFLAKDSDRNVVVPKDVVVRYGSDTKTLTFKLRAGTYDPFEMGKLGVPDLAFGVVKKAFVVADDTPVDFELTYAPVVVPPSPPAAPVPAPGAPAPAPAPSTGSPTDFGKASSTAEEDGDDHIPLPGPLVDPRTWVLKTNQAGPVPMKNTMRQAAPDWGRDLASMAVDNWPDAVWLPQLGCKWMIGGGHSANSAGFSLQTFLSCLMYQSRNAYPHRIAATEEDAFTGPDDVGPFDIPSPPHGYNGYDIRDAACGCGPEAVVAGTKYGTSDNRIMLVNPKMKQGGGWYLFEKGKGVPLGGYASGASSIRRKGYFIGDTRTGADFFCPFDGGPRKQVPSVIPQWFNGKMLVDEQRGLRIGINGFFSGPDGNPPNYRKFFMVVADLMDDSVPLVTMEITGWESDDRIWHRPDGSLSLEPDRMGFTGAGLGVGMVGLRRSTNGGGLFVRIRWNDPKDWRKGAHVETWEPTLVGITSLPMPVNDVYGSLCIGRFLKDQGVDDVLAVYDYSADAPAIHAVLPQVE